MKALPQHDEGETGFQIAPLVDVVFVILVFFMALAAQIKIEQILATKLPGTAIADGPVEFYDEQIIAIASDGEVMLNDEPYDNPLTKTLPELRANLMRLQQMSDAANTKLVVTIISDEDSLYDRTIDVLNALAAAGVTNVSFTVSSDF